MVPGVTVVSLSDVPATCLVWQLPQSVPVLTVVARATFVIQPDEVALAPEQEPPSPAEQPYPDGSSRGVYAPNDLVPLKHRTDVLLVGPAYAPRRAPVRSFFTRLAVGEVDKRIEIHGDRSFDLQGELREGPRIASMPLTWERAAGGPETANPLGVRPDVRDAYGRLKLPNLQPPGREIASPSDFIGPIGYGPIGSTWPTRHQSIGPTLASRPLADWQGQIVPSDLDPSHFQAAPRDQQIAGLREDERIALENLHPDHPELGMRLPGVRPRVFVEGRPTGPQALAMRADTLWIDTGRGIFTVTWRGQCPYDQAGLTVLVALERAGTPLPWEVVDQMRRQPRVPEKPAPPPPPAPRQTAPPPPGDPPAPAPAARPGPPPPPKAPPPPPTRAAIATGPEPLYLIGFEAEALRPLRRDPKLAKVLPELKKRPVEGAEIGLAPAAIEERREAFEMLAGGTVTSEEGVRAALAGAMLGDGTVVQPVMLLEGELALALDPLAGLRALVATALPHAGADAEAKAILDLVRDFLRSRGPVAATVAEGLRTHIRDTFEKRGLVQAGYLEPQVERALLQARLYLERGVFGAPHLVAHFTVGPGTAPIPTYVGVDLAAKLPASVRLRARLIAEVHPSVDPNEAHPAALRAVALALVLAAPRR